MLTVTKGGLDNVPLYEEGLIADDGKDIRVSTVHRVKGESIPAVLYVTNSTSLSRLLSGMSKEEGRIGHVAVTRAADLLIIAIPKTSNASKEKAFSKIGILEWGRV